MYDLSEEVQVYTASLPYMSAAKDLANALQMNDHGPLHAQRVHSITKRICSLFSLTQHEQSLVLASALLHDIGMAKDRENHHTASYDIVKEMAQDKTLPFNEEEAEIVATLCKWHRKEYDPYICCSKSNIRLGLLASILRLADGMDLDYRRSDDFDQKEKIINLFHKGQRQHHLSVRNILALRFNISRMEIRVEVFLNKFDHASLQLGRLVDEMIHTPISWPIQIIPVHDYVFENIFNKEDATKKAIVFSYCNPHGAISAAISKRQLEALGFDTQVVFDSKHTGYAPKFWNKYFLDWDFKNIDLVVILDLHLSDDQVDPVLNKIKTNSHCHWICASVLEISNSEIKQMVSAGINILLGDERALFAGNSINDNSFFWMKVAGLCNFDDHILSSANIDKEEYNISRGLRHALWELMNNKSEEKEYLDLIDKIVANEKSFFTEREPLWEKVINDRLPTYTKYGRVLVLGNADIAGRFIYDIAERLIEIQGLLRYEKNEFATPYVIYRRASSRGVVILFFSSFNNPNMAFPVKYFVSQCSGQVGSSSSIWQTYPDEESAKDSINETLQRINAHFKVDCQNIVESI